MHFYAKIISSFAVLPLALVVGCGDDTNPSTSGGNGALTLEQFADKVNSAACASAVKCRNAETEAECVATSDANLPEQYVENGTVKFVPEKADACLSELGAVDACSLSSLFGAATQGAACAEVFEGTVADGGACFNSEQCVSGFCVETDPSCTEACCPGTCAPSALPKIGEACPDGRCEADAYCQASSMMCAAKIAEGQACSDLFACKAPALCDLDFLTGMGTCKKPAGTGETCNPQSLFACDRMDELCDPMTMKCTPKGVVGADCGDDDECVGYAYCDGATSKCAKDLAEGAACTSMVDCQGDLWCDTTSMKCALIAPTVCK